jgi:predicted alpha/beta-hydrolase family hydrolase
MAKRHWATSESSPPAKPVEPKRMDAVTPIAVQIPTGDSNVSGLFIKPAGATACYVFAHGAGAGMDHSFMTSFALGLAARSVATLRFQFPYVERGSKRVDSPLVAQQAIQAAVAKASELGPGLTLFAGGKSFGGRMTSQAQAAGLLHDVAGLVFLGFPLHPADKPSTTRAAHLSDVSVPMLFLQGTKDGLADLELLRGVTQGLGTNATLHQVEHADHSFHVLVRSGRTDAQVLDELLTTAVSWMQEVS